MGPNREDQEDEMEKIEVGHISVVFNTNQGNLTIMELDTSPYYKGYGVGTFLLRYVAVEATRLSKQLVTIDLDDMVIQSG